jgi:hypothetical protein
MPLRAVVFQNSLERSNSAVHAGSCGASLEYKESIWLHSPHSSQIAPEWVTLLQINEWFMTDLGKLLILLGGAIVIAGILLILVGRLHLPVGRLPGDIVYRGKNTTFYFPLATSILVSVVLTLVLYVVGRWRR